MAKSKKSSKSKKPPKTKLKPNADFKSKSKPNRVVRSTTTFRKDLRSAGHNAKYDEGELRNVMNKIEQRSSLDQKYNDHPLQGRYPDQKGGHTDCRECHASNDWLLIYRFPDDDSVHFIRTGTHSELF